MITQKTIISYIKSSAPLYLLFLFIKKYRANLRSKRYSPAELIRLSYKKGTGLELNLDTPLRFTEKIQWLKLNYVTPEMTRCADKYLVRHYVKERGYKHTLNEILGIYQNTSEINIDTLPDKFILKTTHSSGWNLICTCKKDWIKNWYWWKRILNFWLKEDYSNYYQELHYKNIKPQIICEKFLGDEQHGLNDYKFFYFNGTLRLIQVDIQRYTKHQQNFYDENWGYISMNAGVGSYEDHELYRPKKLEEMKKMGMDLAEGFPHARVDLYEYDNKIYFGEITFFDGSGYYKTEPSEFDYKMGAWLALPEKYPNNLK